MKIRTLKIRQIRLDILIFSDTIGKKVFPTKETFNLTYGVLNDQNVKMFFVEKEAFQRSDFTYGVSTYGILALKNQL